jgi:hypothetical protein
MMNEKSDHGYFFPFPDLLSSSASSFLNSACLRIQQSLHNDLNLKQKSDRDGLDGLVPIRH